MPSGVILPQEASVITNSLPVSPFLQVIANVLEKSLYMAGRF